MQFRKWINTTDYVDNAIQVEKILESFKLKLTNSLAPLDVVETTFVTSIIHQTNPQTFLSNFQSSNFCPPATLSTSTRVSIAFDCPHNEDWSALSIIFKLIARRAHSRGRKLAKLITRNFYLFTWRKGNRVWLWVSIRSKYFMHALPMSYRDWASRFVRFTAL